MTTTIPPQEHSDQLFMLVMEKALETLDRANRRKPPQNAHIWLMSYFIHKLLPQEQRDMIYMALEREIELPGRGVPSHTFLGRYFIASLIEKAAEHIKKKLPLRNTLALICADITGRKVDNIEAYLFTKMKEKRGV